MEIKEQIEKVFQSVSENKTVLEDFKKDPKAVVSKMLGSCPDEIVSKVTDGVKAKLAGDKAAGVLSKVGKLFKK